MCGKGGVYMIDYDYAAIANQVMEDYPSETLIPLTIDNPDFDGILTPLLEHFWASLISMSKPLHISMMVSIWHVQLAYAMGYKARDEEIEAGLREMFGDE
jgi:hypothetical protein